jgi:hypothetical protein
MLRNEGDEQNEEIKRRKFCVKNVYVWHLPTVIIVTVNKNRYFFTELFHFCIVLLVFAKKVKDFEKF